MKVSDRIKNAAPRMVGLIVLFCLSACAGLNARNENYRRSDSPLLGTWLEETLVPYLVRQFSQHPRFKGEAILLVRMQGENISDNIDDLTQQIREKITDALLQENGLNLVWRPSNIPWQHQRSLGDLVCGGGGRIRYYIGIDTGLSQASRELYVKVKALNLSEHKWVSGFGKSWAGVPAPEQLKALQRMRPDEHLLGMRPRPFSDRQPDLLAAYLAGRLSCKLKRGESDDLIVHFSPPAPDSPPVVRTALKLVERYLARFKEVEVTASPEHANITLVSAVHSVDKDLLQVWLSARQREAGIYLPEAETEAYLRLTAPPDASPAPVARVKPQPASPPAQYLRQPPAPDIIVSFNLLTPLDQTRCTAGNSWRSAARRLRPQTSLGAGSCLAVEMVTAAPAYVFVMSQDPLGELSKIFPSQCPALAKLNPLVRAGELFQLPALTDPRGGVLEIGGPPGTERIYAIAILTSALAAEFVDRIDDIQGLCRAGKVFPNAHLTASRRLPRQRILWWQNYLSRLSHDHPGQIDWRELKFDHRQL